MTIRLRHLDKALERRHEIAEIYNDALGELRNITLPTYEENRVNAYWLYPIYVPRRRDSFAEYMQDNGIQVDKHNDRNDKYSIFGGLRNDLPNTERIDRDIVHIPIHPALTKEEVQEVIRRIRIWNRSVK